MSAVRLALVGIGKIARDQHVPALSQNADFELVAGVSRHHALEALPNFRSLAELLAAMPDVDAVSICTPPQARFEIAQEALANGLDVMLEKPPGATLNEVETLARLAAAARCTLYTSWHSRAAGGVEPARRLLQGKNICAVRIDWREDVRVWHPGQAWIWKAGGLGVFDPGINALSVLTRILAERVRITNATLSFPANCETPIAAKLTLLGERGAPVEATFDFLYAGSPRWQIEVDYEGGSLRLSKGGAVLEVNGDDPLIAPDHEYRELYRRFTTLVNDRQSEVDVEPLQLVADAFLCGRRIEVEPFVE